MKKITIKHIKTCETFEYFIEEQSDEQKIEDGSTCTCYVARCDRRLCLIKQFHNYSEAAKDAELLNERITIIKEIYQQEGLNYFLDDYFIGCSIESTSVTYYQVFRYHEGETLVPNRSTAKNEEKIKPVIEQFHNFLCGLKVFHDHKLLHMDIKPANIFSFPGNECNTHWLQLIDFGSLGTIDDVKNNFKKKKRRTFSSSRPWYLEEDESKLIEELSLGNDGIIKVMDCTASARILAFMLCGHDTENSKLPPSEEELNHFLDQLPQEGVRLALERFFAKAFADDLKDRYLVSDMISHIEYIRDSYREKPKTVAGYKIKTLNNGEIIEDLRKHYRQNHDKKDHEFVSVDELLLDIDTSILPQIKVRGRKPFIKYNYQKGSPLSQIMRTIGGQNLFVIGEGGAGKSSALLREYILNLKELDSDEIYLFIQLKRWKNPNQGIMSYISNILPTFYEEKQIVCLLDAFDEIETFQKAEQNKKEDFIKNFFNQISSNANIRFVVSSRVSLQYISNSPILFCEAEFLPLKKKQIKDYLNISSNQLNIICENRALLKLLQNTFLLTIYKTLRNQLSANIHITSPVELMDLFFLSMYEKKNGALRDQYCSKEEFFYQLMDFVAECSFYEKNNQNSYLNNMDSLNINLRHKALSCYGYIVELSKTSDGWTIQFAHSLYKEYFVSKYLHKYIKELFSHFCITSDTIKVLGEDYTYQTLEFLSQILFPQNNLIQRVSNKACFEKLFQCITLWDEQNELDDEWYRNYTIISGTIKNLLRIIVFAFNDLTEFDFGDLFFEIPSNAFSNWETLTQIKLPKQIRHIGDHAFFNCKELRRISLPEEFIGEKGTYLCGIGSQAFAFCPKLSSISFPKGTRIIESDVLNSCLNINTVYIPFTVFSIGSNAFEGCFQLKHVFYDGTTHQWEKIYKHPTWRYFSGPFEIVCTNGVYIEDAFLPNGLEIVENNNEKGISSVGYCEDSVIEIPDSINYISMSAFNGCDYLTKISMNVQYIDCFAFSSCYELTTINLGAKLKAVGCEAFEGYIINRNVFFDGGLKEWSDIVFDSFDSNPCNYRGFLYFGKKLVKEVVYGSQFKEIKNYAFSGCVSIQQACLGRELKKIGSGVFYRCTNLSYIKFDGSVTEWKTIEINNESHIWYEKSAINCVICEDGVVTIPNKHCKNIIFKLNSDGVSYSVMGLVNESESMIDSSFKSDEIENEDFLDSWNKITDRLSPKEIIIPKFYMGMPVTKIHNNAFQNNCIDCLYIPNSIESIGPGALYGLNNFVYHGSKKEWESISKNDIANCDYLVHCFDGNLGISKDI